MVSSAAQPIPPELALPESSTAALAASAGERALATRMAARVSREFAPPASTRVALATKYTLQGGKGQSAWMVTTLGD